MKKPLCNSRKNSGTKHSQQPDSGACAPDVHSKQKVSTATPWTPGMVGIIDGEREDLPE